MIPGPPETRASLILRLPDAADVGAWDEFVSIYGPVVWRLAVRQGMQPADADNLVQEVFASVAGSVFEWIDREDRGSFRAWLMRIARNQAVNMLTRRASRPWGLMVRRRSGYSRRCRIAIVTCRVNSTSSTAAKFSRGRQPKFASGFPRRLGKRSG